MPGILSLKNTGHPVIEIIVEEISISDIRKVALCYGFTEKLQVFYDNLFCKSIFLDYSVAII